MDEGGDGHYESLRHGTYSHHQRMVVYQDKLIVYWTNHSHDENGPGQRVLAKVGTFGPDRSAVDWGGDETLVELAPAPMPVRRRLWHHDPDVMYEGYASAMLQLINGKLYVRAACLRVTGGPTMSDTTGDVPALFQPCAGVTARTAKEASVGTCGGRWAFTLLRRGVSKARRWCRTHLSTR